MSPSLTKSSSRLSASAEPGDRPRICGQWRRRSSLFRLHRATPQTSFLGLDVPDHRTCHDGDQPASRLDAQGARGEATVPKQNQEQSSNLRCVRRKQPSSRHKVSIADLYYGVARCSRTPASFSSLSGPPSHSSLSSFRHSSSHCTAPRSDSQRLPLPSSLRATIWLLLEEGSDSAWAPTLSSAL